MLGENIGTLSLQYKVFRQNESTEIWRKDGNQGVLWNHAQISVDQHEFYQVQLINQSC